jgi:hypothetical protein
MAELARALFFVPAPYELVHVLLHRTLRPYANEHEPGTTTSPGSTRLPRLRPLLPRARSTSSELLLHA